MVASSGFYWSLYTFIYETVRHQLRYMQLYNTQHAYIFVLCQAGNIYGLNIPYHLFKFNSTQLYFMVYCIESLPQPSSNWKFNWRWPDLNPDLPSTSLPRYQLSCTDWMFQAEVNNMFEETLNQKSFLKGIIYSK